MISVLIVGNGNVAFHLEKVFSKLETISSTKISSRKLSRIPKADITIIAVSDDAIAEVSSKIENDFVVHVSGTKDLSELKNNSRKGVFYMLQSFSKDKSVDFSKIPFCLEAENSKDFNLLKRLALTIGKDIYQISSKDRKVLHVAAVFANNFTNQMYKIAKDICDTQNIPFKVLLPLIEETALKIKSLDPIEARTGPAVRNDIKTIENHLTLLTEKQKEIYKLLTKSIQNGD